MNDSVTSLEEIGMLSGRQKTVVQRKLADANSPRDRKGSDARRGPSKAVETAQVGAVTRNLQVLMGLLLLYVMDKGLSTLCQMSGVKFPSSLIGMFAVFALLCLVGDKTAISIERFSGPTLDWIGRWLPLFYVASLVTLPLALQGMRGTVLAKLVGILLAGMAATLLFTAQAAMWIRAAVKTEMKQAVKSKPAPPFTASHYVLWATVGLASLAASLAAPTTFGRQLALPFNLAATVGGFLLGSAVPPQLHGVLHPVVVCALVANGGAALHGRIVGWSYEESLKAYLAKGTGPMGAGDLLMSFLGMVIISFGLRIYAQRGTMKRHAPEILGATFVSSLFSMFSTAFACKAAGLPADLSRALVPRSVTVALALPIAGQLEAPAAITAAAVLLTGLLAANFGPQLMNVFGIKDTIARGLAAAAAGHGLGTASLTAKEPEALPFCALSYSMIGVFSTVLAAVPLVRELLLAVLG